MNKIEDILEKLLEDSGCYDEDKIKERMKSWPGRHSRRNALYNIGLKSGCFDENQISIIEAWNIFNGYFKNQSDFEFFINKLNQQDKERFLDLAHFYYCWCKDPELYAVLDESFKLIIMTSIIEALMSGYDFKEFYDWFCSDCPKSLIEKSEKISDSKKRIKILWDEYKKNHGAIKKVKEFFNSHVSKSNQDLLIDGFKSLDKKPVNFNQIVGFLYKMRSDFVHNAGVVMLAEDGSSLGHIIDGKPLSIKIIIGRILIIFEQGFIEYFKKL